MFSLVSVCSQGGVSMCGHYPWCIAPHCTYSPQHQTIRHGTPAAPWSHTPASDIQCPSLETCSNLFTWGHPHQYSHLVAKVHMVGNQAVRILLECFLVTLWRHTNITIPSGNWSCPVSGPLTLRLKIDGTCRAWIHGQSYVTPIVYLHWKLSWLVTVHRIM